MRGAVVCFLLFGLSPWVCGQTGGKLKGQFVGFEAPIREVHVFEVPNPVTGEEVWKEVVAVSENGEFQVSLESGRINYLVLKSVPYRWTVVARPFEHVAITCAPPSEPSLSPLGKTTWTRLHPYAHADSLLALMQRAEQSIAEELRSLMHTPWSVDAEAWGRLDSACDVVEAGIASARLRLEGEDPAYSDLISAAEARWCRIVSLSGRTCVAPAPRAFGRSEELLLASPGYVSWMVEAYSGWWTKSRSMTALRHELQAIPADSLRALGQAMGVESESPWSIGCAWLVYGMQQDPEFAQRAIARFSFPKAIQDASKALLAEATKLHSACGVEWYSEDGSYVVSDSLLLGKWSYILVVRDGSSECERARARWSQMQSQIQRDDVQFLVLSLDGSLAGWNSTRTTRRPGEQLGWLGNSPKAIHQLRISTLPALLAVAPDGFMHSVCDLDVPEAVDCIGALPQAQRFKRVERGPR